MPFSKHIFISLSRVRILYLVIVVFHSEKVQERLSTKPLMLLEIATQMSISFIICNSLEI